MILVSFLVSTLHTGWNISADIIAFTWNECAVVEASVFTKYLQLVISLIYGLVCQQKHINLCFKYQDQTNFQLVLTINKLDSAFK